VDSEQLSIVLCCCHKKK